MARRRHEQDDMVPPQEGAEIMGAFLGLFILSIALGGAAHTVAGAIDRHTEHQCKQEQSK